MPVTLTEFGSLCNRFRKVRAGIMPRMAKAKDQTSVNSVLWRNVQALMKYHWQDESVSRLGRDTKIAQGGATRLRDGANVGVRLVEKIAHHFGIEPWQLLCPDFDPAKTTTVSSDDEFLKRLLNIYPDLTPRQRKRIASLAQDYSEENEEKRQAVG